MVGRAYRAPRDHTRIEERRESDDVECAAETAKGSRRQRAPSASANNSSSTQIEACLDDATEQAGLLQRRPPGAEHSSSEASSWASGSPPTAGPMLEDSAGGAGLSENTTGRGLRVHYLLGDTARTTRPAFRDAAGEWFSPHLMPHQSDRWQRSCATPEGTWSALEPKLSLPAADICVLQSLPKQRLDTRSPTPRPPGAAVRHKPCWCTISFICTAMAALALHSGSGQRASTAASTASIRIAACSAACPPTTSAKIAPRCAAEIWRCIAPEARAAEHSVYCKAPSGPPQLRQGKASSPNRREVRCGRVFPTAFRRRLHPMPRGTP